MGCYMKIDGDTIEVNKCVGSLRALAELKHLSEDYGDSLDGNELAVEDHGDWFSVEVYFYGQVSYSGSSNFTACIQALGPWTRQPACIRDWCDDDEEWGEFWVASSTDAARLSDSQAKMSVLTREAELLLPDHLNDLIKHLQSLRSKRKREAKKAALEAKICPVH